MRHTFVSILVVFLLVIFTESKANDKPVNSTLTELSILAGSPAGLNAGVGFWWSEIPLVARFSGGFWGIINGVEADIGIPLFRGKNFRHFISATGGSAFVFWGIGSSSIIYGGPSYVLNFKGWTLKAGGNVYRAAHRFLIWDAGERIGIGGHAQIGYTFDLL